MDHPGSLPRALAEWRRLAEAEGHAIRSGNWSFVIDCQKSITALRATIDELTLQSRSAEDPFPKRPSQRSIVLELIELQRRNLAALQQRREKLSHHIENVTRASRNLRGIQRSYAPAAPSGWSSYS
ncbi:MAG TPA: hypothetical protein VKY92_01390 [Verrucomicrobiae bacterium]|nr:hypothetical protein [Verrucomicrobiae bacterium]